MNILCVDCIINFLRALVYLSYLAVSRVRPLTYKCFDSFYIYVPLVFMPSKVKLDFLFEVSI